MAKNCLNRLVSNLTIGCTIDPVGVKNIYLMYADEVTFAYADNTITGVTFAAGARSILVEGYKQNIQVTTALKTTDVSARVDSSISFKVRSGSQNRLRVNAIATGKFYVLVMYNDGDYMVVGDTVPLECSAVDSDSNAGAKMYTITLASPEGSAGNQLTSVSASVRDSIISKVGV